MKLSVFDDKIVDNKTPQVECRLDRIRRLRAEARGRGAETMVAAWFEHRGFTILGRRMKTARGEIDLVVADSDHLVFVEVKLRARVADAAASVSRRQQARIAGAAEIVLAENPSWQRDSTRFDVMLVVSGAIIPIEDAFRPGDAG